MAIEPRIHARLSEDLSALAVFPTVASDGAQPPFLVYTVTSADTANSLSGPSDLTLYSFTVDSYALTAPDLLTLMASVKVSLHGWRDAEEDVMHCWQTSHSTTPADNGYQGQQSFNIWAK